MNSKLNLLCFMAALVVLWFEVSVPTNAKPDNSPRSNNVEPKLCRDGEGCSRGQQCFHIWNRYVCMCQSDCPVSHQPVCGDDGKTYPNECTLNAWSCNNGYSVKMRFPLPCESEINDLRTSRPTRRQTTGMSVSKFKQDSDRENVDSKYFKKVKSKKHHSSEETESETTIEMMNGRLQAEKARKNADVEDCQ